MSTVSVYAQDDVAGQDESAPLADPALPGDEYDYSREKSAAEASVRVALADRAAILRPGLVVGPGDPTDRFGYWVARFALAGDAAVLAPEPDGVGVSVIDVDDLADAVFAVGRDRWTGIANAVGDGIPLADVLAVARDVAGHTGDLVTAEAEWLTAHDVSYWMGPRSLPLWLPAEAIGHWTRSNAAYRALGGGLRPLRETLERTLADEQARGVGRERALGPDSHRRGGAARRTRLAVPASRGCRYLDLHLVARGGYGRGMPSASLGSATLVTSSAPARRRLSLRGRRL